MKKLILTVAVLVLSAMPGMAQNDSQIFVAPGTNYSNTGDLVRRQLKKQSFAKTNAIEVGNVQVSLVHHHYMEPDQFGLMMALPDSVSGCFDVSPLEYEANFIGDLFMDIEVKSFRRKPQKTQNVAYDCDQTSKTVTGLVVLSAGDLQKRGIKQIRFSNGKARDAYDIIYSEDSITLKPDSMIAFKAQNLTGADKDKIVHYFSGKSLVAVHVPMARDGEDIAQHVRNLAYKSALQPVFDQEGLDTSGKDNVFYFMDPQGRLLDQLGESGYTEIGEIPVLRPYDGPQGRQGLAVPLKVFVTRPSTKL